ncbi:hypothetical protein ABK040_002481 [Willaertia magna]
MEVEMKKNSSDTFSKIAIILSSVAIVTVLAFTVTFTFITFRNVNDNALYNNQKIMKIETSDKQNQKKPLLFHISDKAKFSVGLGNIQNLNNVLQQKAPYTTIVTNSDAVSEYFNNATVATMKVTVENYRTQIKCCRIALTKYLISSGKCVNDNATINSCVDQVIANEMPKFVTVVPSGIVYINDHYSEHRYIKP